MEVTDFTQHGAVLQIIDELKYDKIDERIVSDITDGEFQYVDLVMEGGGVLGIALAGYVHVMEQMKIRFLQLGGASAGAINTILMAVGGKIDSPKTEFVLQQIANKNLYDFVDGDNGAKRLINAVVNDGSIISKVLGGVQEIGILDHQYGLNPGKNFHDWLAKILKENNAGTTAEFNELRKNGHDGELYNRNDTSKTPLSPEIYERVVIIASDITTESKIIFPEMAKLYWANPDDTCPADYVRASMSIPFFFYPFKVKNIPKHDGTWDDWKKFTGYVGDTPTEVTFVDGGVMSNFPIDVFHEFEDEPACPTFGVKLGDSRSSVNNTDTLLNFIGSMF